MNYWEQEQPAVVNTGKNILRYFEQASKLQVSMPSWTDDKGEEKPGKTVTIDLSALRGTPEAVELLGRVIGHE